MKLEISDIQDRVAKREADMSTYKRWAEAWEDTWGLRHWKDSQETALKEGREQITLPTPYNTVNLAQRLISSSPKIDVPPMPKEGGTEGADSDSDEKAALIERWLTAFWQQIQRAQNRNIFADLTWMALVRGRFCLEIKWIEDLIPEAQRKRRLPFLVRTIDPLCVGRKEGPIYTDYAYRKYTDDILSVRQNWPKWKGKNRYVRRYDKTKEEEFEVEVIEFWWTNRQTGKIWNAVVVDDDWAKRPVETDYPDIPFIENYGDSAPLDKEEYRGMSILHPIVQTGAWKSRNRIASQMATGLLWYFWPAIVFKTELGAAPPKGLSIGPGITNELPPGVDVELLQINPNVPLAQAVDGLLDGEIQNSTFPGVMYGKAPGEIQAGYGVSLLADQAAGRIKAFIENLQFAIAKACEFVLALVEEFGDEKGVDVWGMSEADGKPYRLTLKPSDVKGYREVIVSLKPQVPQDMQQRQTLGIRLVEMGIISKQTFLDKFLDTIVPQEEESRVEREQALADPNMKPIVNEAALRKYFGEDWRQQLGIPEPPRPQAPPPPQGPPPGPPPGMMGPPGGPPPNMPPPGPPMPPPPPPVQPPAMLNGPMGGGIPPEMQGQLTPEGMGLPANMPPLDFAALTGQNVPPAEELDLLSGLPPGVM